MSSRRSSADRRDTYYQVNVARCAGYPAFMRTADELEIRVGLLIARLTERRAS